MRQVRFARIARDELMATCTWLDEQQPGLGDRLMAEVRQTSERIQRMPLMYPIDRDDIRKATLPRFPYSLRYAVLAELVLILAVSHHHRQPDYWLDR